MLATIAAVAATSAIGLPGQTRWELRRPAVAPSPRGLSAAAFLPTQGKVLLFGGWIASSEVIGDTWQWDGDAWEELSPTSSPQARYSSGIAYDTTRDRAVLFGGSDRTTNFGDTWEWDGFDWTRRTPSHAPSPRRGHAMAYDGVRGTVLLHGGTTDEDIVGDMWEWDGATWTRLQPPLIPSPRTDHRMTWDPARQRVVLYGGMAPWGVYHFEDTWEWDGATWSLRSASSPPGSQSHFGMAYEARRGMVILHARGSTFVRDGETWVRSIQGVAPDISFAGTMVAAPGGSVLHFGGFESAQRTNATWELVAAPPSGSWATFGAGCGGSAVHPALTSVGPPPQLGSPFRVRASNLPTDRSALMVVGVSRTSAQGLTLPFDLGTVGMPDCWLYVSPDVVMPLFVQAGVADWSIMVPPDARLFGQSFFQQAFGIDRAANALGMVTSNAAEGRIGSP